MNIKAIYTTGQVAKLCNVAPHTVSRWFDRGILTGYRMPGGIARRIPRAVLLEFFKRYHIQVPLELDEETSSRYNVIAVCVDVSLLNHLYDLLPKNQFNVKAVASAFEAGVSVVDLRPDIVVVDTSMGRGDALRVVKSMKCDDRFVGSTAIVVVGEDEVDAAELLRFGFSLVFKRPFDPAAIVQVVMNLASVSASDGV